MRWETERTDEFEEWWGKLSKLDQRRIFTSLEVLEEDGPSTGRPWVDSVKGSRHPNMKELRAAETIRIFFAFDPRRVAILLIGGDKTGRVRRFYRQMVVRADTIYEGHIRRIRSERTSLEKG